MPKNREKRERRMVSAKKAAALGGNTFERPALNVPPGCSVFGWSKEGVYRYNVLPYELKKGHANPRARTLGLGEGDLYYERGYYVHRLPGEGNDALPCLKRNFNKPCPGCEERAKAIAEYGGDSDEAKAHKPKFRQLYNVEDLAEPEKGVQVFEYSQFGFGETLDTKINSADDDDDVEFFYAPDERGKTLKIVVKDQKIGSNSFFKAVDIEFKARKEHPGEEVLEKTFNLDDMVKEISYAEFQKRYMAAPPVEGDEDDAGEDDEPKKPAGGKKPAARKPADDDDDDLDETDDDTDAEVGNDGPEWAVGQEVSFKYQGKTRIGKIKKINATKELAMVDWGGKDLASVAFDDLKLVEPDEDDDEPEEKPQRGKKPVAKKPDPEEEEEDEDDELDGDSDLDDDDLDDEPEDDDPDDDGDDSVLEFDEDEDEPEEDEKPQRGKKPAATTKPAGKKPGKK